MRPLGMVSVVKDMRYEGRDMRVGVAFGDDFYMPDVLMLKPNAFIRHLPFFISRVKKD